MACGGTIAKMHFVERYRAIPDAVIEPAFIGGDPVGFIRVKNPPQDFAIVNTY